MASFRESVASIVECAGRNFARRGRFRLTERKRGWFRRRGAKVMRAIRFAAFGQRSLIAAISGSERLVQAMRDTILVMPKSRAHIAFDANNPGRWAFHCHNLYHMASGMLTEFRYEGIAV
jgi:hypothetical protein